MLNCIRSQMAVAILSQMIAIIIMVSSQTTGEIEMTPEKLWNKCLEAAKEAADKSKPDMFCGFAHVNIKPARGPFVSYLKSIGKGDSGWPSGYDISFYSLLPENHEHHCTQSMTVRENVCLAVVEVLRNNGVNARMRSRAD